MGMQFLDNGRLFFDSIGEALAYLRGGVELNGRDPDDFDMWAVADAALEWDDARAIWTIDERLGEDAAQGGGLWECILAASFRSLA